MGEEVIIQRQGEGEGLAARRQLARVWDVGSSREIRLKTVKLHLSDLLLHEAQDGEKTLSL